MLILRSAAKWRARPGRHFPSLTKASHAVDIPVKKRSILPRKYLALNRVRDRAQVEYVDRI
jgi:hypothetical protein